MLSNKKNHMRFIGLLVAGITSIIFPYSAYAAKESPETVYLDDLSISLNADSIPDEFWDKGANFEVRKDNSVRSITITGSDIATYKNIHVGDPINKVKSKYMKEYEADGMIGALINGETELDTAAVLEMDEGAFTDEILDSVFLQYTYDEGMVTEICIARVSTMLNMDLYVNPDAITKDVQLRRNQVYVNGEILTYNEVVPDSLKIFVAESSFSDDIPEGAPLKIFTNKDGVVRGIYVLARTVQTYDGITVGMNKTDIFATYEKYIESPSYVDIYYNGDELLSEEDMPATMDDYFCYSYRTDNAGTISRIFIWDKQYATTLQ